MYLFLAGCERVYLFLALALSKTFRERWPYSEVSVERIHFQVRSQPGTVVLFLIRCPVLCTRYTISRKALKRDQPSKIR